MGEESKKVTKVYNTIQDNSKYTHHKEGSFVCESEVEESGKIICCLHDPVSGKWEFKEKK